jgi:MFS-type transporter involved in bile tolerance (Atg22 family)
MSCITEIQEAVVIVIIWWCYLQLHMACITEIQVAVVVVIIWWWTTTAPCISVIHDICSCKSHHHMFTNTMAPCISVIYDIFSCKSHHHLQLHMLYITEIQGAILVVIIWLCDLQLHMSCITEIHVAAVVVVIIWWHM